MDDIIGFGHNPQVLVSTGTGIVRDNTMIPSINCFRIGSGYTNQERNPRMIADINGDGYPDLVGFQDSKIEYMLAKNDGTGYDG